MIHTFNSTDDLAVSLAEKVIHLARMARRDGKSFNIALSGGSTPYLLFKKMATASGDPGIWEHLHFYWVDERCVPPDHKDSNYRMAQESLFRPISLSLANIHRMRGEEDPRTESYRYEALLLSQLPDRHGMP